MPTTRQDTRYERRLSLFDGTMVVIGGIIGSGIFLNPAIVAQRVGSPGWILVAWALGGAVALIGALCFAELGARRPAAGGGYVYLREALHPMAAFLYGWTLLLVINTGAVAAVAVTFARYAADLLGLAPATVNPLAIGAVVLLTGINYVGIRPGSLAQNIFTILKMVALAGLVFAAFLLTVTDATGAAREAAAAPGGWGVLWAVGAALVPVLFSYGGWQNANFVAEEMVDARRTLPRALVIGVSVVVGTYLLANVAYLHTLGPEGLATSLAPASDTMRAVLGSTGGTIMAAGIVISTFGLLNLLILAAPRVYRAMADDGLFFEWAARLHPRYRTPGGALLFQAAWAGLLVLTGTYGQLLDYVVFGDWIFFGLVAATIFVYRRREPQDAADAGFRMAGYPWLPAIFIAAAVLAVASSIGSNPVNALVGAALIGAGVPVYLFWNRDDV